MGRGAVLAVGAEAESLAGGEVEALGVNARVHSRELVPARRAEDWGERVKASEVWGARTWKRC